MPQSCNISPSFSNIPPRLSVCLSGYIFLHCFLNCCFPAVPGYPLIFIFFLLYLSFELDLSFLPHISYSAFAYVLHSFYIPNINLIYFSNSGLFSPACGGKTLSHSHFSFFFIYSFFSVLLCFSFAIRYIHDIPHLSCSFVYSVSSVVVGFQALSLLC